MATIFSPTKNGVVNFKEVNTSPHEAYQHGQLSLTRIFDVTPFTDRWHFISAMLGFSRLTQADDGTVWVSRTTPDAYEILPSANGTPWVYAAAVTAIEGHGCQGATAPNGDVVYTLARVSVSYESPSYTVLDDTDDAVLIAYKGANIRPAQAVPDESQLTRYVTRAYQPTAEALILPRGAFRWVNTTLRVPNTNTKIQPSAEVIYTWHQVPGIPQAAQAFTGCVNAPQRGSVGGFFQPDATTNFDPSFRASFSTSLLTAHAEDDFGFPPGTLLLTGVEVRPSRNLIGIKVYDVVYKMKYFSAINPTPLPGTTGLFPYFPARGHNYFLRYTDDSTPLDYQLITHNGNNTNPPAPEYPANNFFQPPGNAVFRAVDFRQLFMGPFLRDPDQA